MYNLLSQLNFKSYLFTSFKPSPNSYINLNEFVLDHVMYKMIRKFADKISFVKYNDRHVQNTIYWFMRFNQTYNTELVDNILHNFIYLHDTTFPLDFSDFGKAKKMNQF